MVTSQYIKTVKDVMEVINLGSSRGIKEGYDSTVSLLCNSGTLLTEILGSNLITNEEHLELLIISMVCSNLSDDIKLNIITKLILLHKERLVKAAIIDGLSYLYESINVLTLINKIEYYLFIDEVDNYIRDCANETFKYLKNLT